MMMSPSASTTGNPHSKCAAKTCQPPPSTTFFAFILLCGLGASTVALGDVAADGRVGKIVGRLLLDQQQRHFALPKRGGTRG